MMAAAEKKQNKMGIKQQARAMKRVLGYMLRNYKFSFFMVVVCILGSALATLRGDIVYAKPYR